MNKMNIKIIIKAGVIGVLILLMLIPLAFVKGTVAGRLNYKNEAELKITSAWGSELYVAAPILNVPYVSAVTKKVEGRQVTEYETSFYKYTPSSLDADVEIVPQIRQIGIFKVPVFTAKVKMKGSFSKPEVPLDSSVRLAPAGKAFVSLEINSLKGVTDTPVIKWNGETREFENALEGDALNVSVQKVREGQGYYSEKTYRRYSDDYRLKMLYAPVASAGASDFELDFSVRGSNSISFIPLAKDNTFKIASAWPHPNFLGGFLPETREVSAKGFKAEWKVNNISSGIPAYLNGFGEDFPFVSVSLMFPVDNYRNSERAVKYGILFVALTFLACFVFEIVNKTPVHPFQYILVGTAMAVFYLLLLSISEFCGFGLSYIISAAATIILVSAYIRYGILKKADKKVFGAVVGLGALYAYLYVLLQLEDLSLFFGTLGLFFGVALVMYATRNINWYE